MPKYDILRTALQTRNHTFCILCSDHGTAYGENGYTGHRLSDPAVWTVPYCAGIIGKTK